jgi:tRNA threonylcarbamoyladenosine biosynthesis protein TsaB
MLVMGLDTALQRCSVAILKDGDVVGEMSVGMERGHAEHLAPMTAAALQQAGKKITDLDRIGVVVGPGGFTGVRVALSFARGLVIGTAVQAVGVTSLAALAGNVAAMQTPPAGTLVAPVIDARRAQVYAALYDAAGETLIEPFVSNPERVLEILLDRAGGRSVLTVGSGAHLLPAAPLSWGPSGASDQINAAVVAGLAAQASLPAGASPAPLYLRAPDAIPPKPGPFDGISSK